MSAVEIQSDRNRANQSDIEMMEVLLALQVMPVQFAELMHAFAESLQCVHKFVVPQRSNSAATSTGLSSASESEHHCDSIIGTTSTTTNTR